MKIMAFYLPQYHEIEENNKWWGKGYTEWNAVKSAHLFFRGHEQPKIPLSENYYDLSDDSCKALFWQTNLAKNYGVDGFCFYHYWFKDGKKLLEKPAELLRSNERIDIEYCFCWANEPWKRTWYSYNDELLVEQEYGDVDEWTNHYKYLSIFFSDNRYIKINNMPVILIYRSAAIEKLSEMVQLWNKLAREEGYEGVYIISGKTSYKEDPRTNCFSAYYRFEPAYTMHYEIPKYKRYFSYLGRTIKKVYNYYSKNKVIEAVENIEQLFKYIPLTQTENGVKVYPGICPSWDNTPRKQHKGTYLKKSSPELFEKELKILRNHFPDDYFLFINAWNEWSEGAYLEPDIYHKYEYLEKIKKVFGE